MQEEKKYKFHADLREDARELLRRNLVDAADHILTTEGANALTVRRIADELNASTKVIYSLFGGKDGLANELYLEGCYRLRHFMEQITPQQKAHDYVIQCGWAYWEFAMQNPGYYAVMFGNAIPQFQPNAESLATVTTAFKILIQNLGEYQASQALVIQDTIETIYIMWSSLHGVISLLNGRHYSQEVAHTLYEKTLIMLTNALFTQ